MPRSEIRRLTIPCLSISIALTLLASVHGETPRQASNALQGTWVATSAERNGEAANDLRGHRLVFEGRRFTISSHEGVELYAGTYRLNADAKPHSIDLVQTKGEAKGQTWKGIYVISGDELKVCDNAPDPKRERPTLFQAPTDSGYVAVVLKRSEDAGEDSDIAALKKRLSELDVAFNERDVATIKQLTTRDHLAVTRYHSTPMNLATSIEMLDDYKVSMFKPSERDVKMLNRGTAMVTFTATVEGTFKGEPLSPHYFASSIWVKRGDEWIEAFYQETTMAKD